MFQDTRPFVLQPIMRLVCSTFLLCLFSTSVAFGQAVDSLYGQKILEYTTDERFVNPMVDHLPASADVPSPLEYFGSIIGAPGILHETSEIYGYFRALDEASDRLQVRSIGMSEEGREMIEVIIADGLTMSNLNYHRHDLNALADPRALSEVEAQRIIERAKPIYYITAGLHSTETGSPEMVMEMAYRLVVSDDEMIRNIRENIILIFTPVAEPDGRDRIVDTYKYRAANDDIGPSLVYWGKYAAHDNNRDGYGLSLALTRNILASFMHWKPQVMHDLHESVSYLYTSTGLGPYNEHIDPITINEWHNLAHEEVGALTSLGMPGVWTHAFYNGWAANYLIWMANTRNSAGRFYETFGNSIPDTKMRKLSTRQTSRQWYRSNPPLEETMWSLRNNTNYMQSGVLTALNYVANNKTEFVSNFYKKSKTAVEKTKEEGPYAWVIPRDQLRTVGTVNLVNLLMDQGLEVHEAVRDFSWHEEDDADSTVVAGSAMKGDFIVRLDQPYRTLALVLLDKQNFPKNATPPYDDTGWTLPYMHNIEAEKVEEADILNQPMRLLSERVALQGGISESGEESGSHYVLNNTTDDNVTVFRFRLPNVKMDAAERAFDVGAHTFNAGSFIIPARGNGRNVSGRINDVAEELGLTLHALTEAPEVPTHAVEVPRVGLIHTWVARPQDAGWWRLAFDRIGIPYTYLSEQDLKTLDPSAFDVLILPRARTSSQALVAGNSKAGAPIPWMRSEAYPHIGKIDQTSDTRQGMGYQGLANLQAFIEGGGVFITSGSTATFPIDMALTRNVSIRRTNNLAVRGSVLRAVQADSLSPILYGYGDELPVYFNQSPVLQVSKNVGSYRDPDWYKDEVWEKEIPRTVLSFAKSNLLMSGMASGESELHGAPAVVDVPVGDGHVVLFAIRPFRRWNTQGSHALVFNTMLHWNDLRTGWPERPSDD